MRTVADLRLSTIVKSGSLADQTTYSVNVTYSGETPRRVSFVGSTLYPGPVVMVQGDLQVFVTDPSRFGPFGPEWVERFFAE